MYLIDLLSKSDDTMEFFSTYERFLALLTSKLTYISYSSAYKPSLPPHIINLIQQKKVLLHLTQKTKHPFYITQLKIYSTLVRREIFKHKRSSWLNYCGTLNSLDVKYFWKKSRKHFSVTNPPINGFLSNGLVISSLNEMCNLAKSFYKD